MNDDDLEDEIEEESQGIEIVTHTRINTSLCGRITLIEDNYAEVTLETTEEMSVDDMGLVHGGFTFGAADYAAMVAINDPNVVLVGAQTRFLAPVKVGEIVVFQASAIHKVTKKRDIRVEGYVGQIKVFEGEFVSVILDEHVLTSKFKVT